MSKLGRPNQYEGQPVEAIIVEVLKSTDRGEGASITKTLRILNARNGVVTLTKAEQANAQKRRDFGIPDRLTISQPTLTKLAAHNRIKVALGRPASDETIATRLDIAAERTAA